MGCSRKAIKGNQEEKLTSIRKAVSDKSRKISRGKRECRVCQVPSSYFLKFSNSVLKYITNKKNYLIPIKKNK